MSTLRHWTLPTLMAISAALTLVSWPALAQNCAVRDTNLQGSYAGDCVAGWASGQGRASGQDRYEGGFRDGLPNSRGIYTFADGRRFEGDFVDGKVQGWARFHYANGDVLEGEFAANRLVGVGRMTRRSGEVLSVALKDGRMSVVVADVPAQTAAPVPGQPGSQFPAGQATVAIDWQPQLDFEDLFPAYILANATRKQPAAGPGTRAAGPAAVDVLATADPAGLVTSVAATRSPAPSAPSARWLGSVAEGTYVGDAWGLVGVRLRSPGPGTKVALRIIIDEIAEPTEVEFTLESAGQYALYPQIRYRWDRLRQVTQPMPVTVTWSLAVNGRPAGSRSLVTRVRSVQDAPLVVATPRGPEITTLVFAGFVTEDAAWIDPLLKEAFNGARVQPVGYQVDPNGVDAQVATLYDYLRRRGVTYSNITTTSGASDRTISQIVRFPSDSLSTSQANCVDGTVLMATLLRKIGIEPIIITGPGHAMLAYYRRPPQEGRDPDVHFVETTGIGSIGFVEAVIAGTRTFKKWVADNPNHPMLKTMPVYQARAAGVMPIPR